MIESEKTIGNALVTGAATRIGAAIARTLAARGYAVAIHYRSSAPEAEALAQEIRTGGGRATLVQADLAHREERAGLVDRAAEALGPLSVLVNNASLYEPDSVETLNEALWDAHFAVHAEAPLFLARDFAAQLPKEGQGNIVNIIDARVFRLTPAYTSYALSKSVLWTATRTMAQNLAPRIRVNAVGPGPTLPEAGQSDDHFNDHLAELPLGYGATAQEVAEAVLYFIGSPGVTGQMLALDGGLHLHWPERSAPTPRQK